MSNVSPFPTVTASHEVQAKAAVAAAALNPAGLAPKQPDPPPMPQADRAAVILQSIAAIAAELGPGFHLTAHGAGLLNAGVLALKLIGEFI